MTTIAWDGYTLAADSGETGGFMRNKVQKIFVLHNGEVISGCGNYTSILEFVDWRRRGARPCDKPVFQEFEAIVWTHGRMHRCEENLFLYPIPAPWSIGSGSQFAMGAMDAGLTAEHAVKIACKRDEGSCLPVRKMQLKH